MDAAKKEAEVTAKAAKAEERRLAKVEEDAELDELRDAMSLKRPKDAISGFGSGLSCIAGGVAGGVAGLVAMPVIGAREGGAKGLATGLAKGVAGLVILPVGGVLTGVTQMVRAAPHPPASPASS